MRRISIIFAALAAAALSQGARAEPSDYSGRWLLSGLINGGRQVMSFAQICDLTQTGTQIAGPCHGPNGACSAVGVVNGAQVDLTCRGATNPSPDAVLTFHGTLAPDGVLRGTCSHARVPGVTGQAALMKI